MMGTGMEQTRKPTLPTVPPARFLTEVIAELKKVTWPTRDETMKLTAVVIAISVIVGLFIGGLDALFVAITGAIFK
jgi:preprotein translocase subunit SecE